MTTASVESEDTSVSDTVELLLYSDDRATREAVRRAVGRRAAAGLPLVNWTEAATHEIAVELAHERRFDLFVLDGEAAKAGGMAVSRQLKIELYECPPVLMLIARPQDAWLASWSRADAVVSAPIDPIELQRTVASLLRAGD